MLLRFRAEADAQENMLRTKMLCDFQGQDRIKDNLSVFIKGRTGTQRGVGTMCSSSAPPGFGHKTTLASIIANEMGAEIRMTSTPALDKPKDLAAILSNVTRGERVLHRRASIA
jgi:Holliday junction DNA helicase RuvB